MHLSDEVFARRRRAFMDRIGTNAAVLLAAAPVAVRSNDVDYNYRQDNDLLYLTGFPEPEAVCLLLPGRAAGEFILFVRPREREKEVWTGRRFGVDGAKETFAANETFEVAKLDEKVIELVADREALYLSFTRRDAFNDRVLGWIRHWRQLRPRSGAGPVAVLDTGEILHEMRLFKSAEELTCMRRAIAISAAAHEAAMRTARDGTYEFEIEALIDGTFRRHGASAPAYPSIVASGVNATILHYTENNRQMRAGDLLLIDAGAEYQGYCADITRTFPIDRSFSAAQRAIYDLVLEAQRVALEQVRPGVAYDEPHKRAVEVLVDGLLSLQLLHGDRAQIIEKEEYKKFYMHRTGHWLGMDVHDVGKYKVGADVRAYEPGMVVTVEPGLYIPDDDMDVPADFRGIGVRIEDDVLVTASASEVLTAAIPKSRADIESLRATVAA